MKWWVCFFVIVVLFGGDAHAGPYMSLGFGSERLGGELQDRFDSRGANSGQLAFGYRIGPIAGEAGVMGSMLDSVTVEAGDASIISVGADVRYFLRISGPLEVFARGGMQRTWLLDHGDPLVDGGSGQGYRAGGGLQVSLPLPPVGALALWGEFTHQDIGLSGSLDGTTQMFLVGLAVGL